MTQRDRERIGNGVFSGLLFVALGVVFLLGNFGLIPVQSLFVNWWPVLLIGIGIKQLLLQRGRMSWLGGAFWAGSGALFLASTLGYLDIEIPRLLWPVVLIWFGVLIAMGCSGHSQSPFNSRGKP